MSKNLFEYAKEFYSYANEHKLSPNARSVYFTLLMEFNARFYTKSLSFTDRQLLDLTGIKSLSRLHDAKNLLKETGFINFRVQPNKPTIYFLIEREQNANGIPQELDRNTGGDFIIRERDLIDIDIKTLDSLESAQKTACARAREEERPNERANTVGNVAD